MVVVLGWDENSLPNVTANLKIVSLLNKQIMTKSFVCPIKCRNEGLKRKGSYRVSGLCGKTPAKSSQTVLLYLLTNHAI